MKEIQYFDFLNMVEDYYGSGSDQWLEVAKYGVSSEQFVDITSQVPNLQVSYHKNGTIAGYYQVTAETGSQTLSQNIASQLNSNVQTKTIEAGTKLKTPAQTTVNAQQEVVATKGVSGGGARKFIAGEVLPALVATGAGISLGKIVSKAAYDSGFNWLSWAGVEMESLNPENWSSITVDMDNNLYEKVMATGFNMLLGIDPNTNKSQAYVEEDAFAYVTAYMIATGVFDNKTQATDYEPITPITLNHGYTYPIKANSVISAWDGTIAINNGYGFVVDYKISESATEYSHIICYAGDSSANYTYNGNTEFIKDNPNAGSLLLNGVTYYYVATTLAGSSFDFIPQSTVTDFVGIINITAAQEFAHDMCLAFYNNNDIFVGGVEGIDDEPNAVLFDPSAIVDPTDIASVLQEIKTQFPDLETNSITNNVVQPDGTVTQYKYLPLPLPNSVGQYDYEPTSDGEYINQTDTEYDPQTMPKEMWDWIWKTIAPTIPADPDIGDGESPAIVTPTGSASALWKIYNPSQLEVDAFGAWLWSSNFVDQLLKVFSNPMEAIITLHKIFVTPSTNGSGPIKVGYLVSNATANYVDAQYVDVDCGSVTLDEFYGNSFDYAPYTDLKIYLPFIGIVDLSVDDCIRGTINVIYHVDVLTGSCLAEVNVERDGVGGMLYTFSGNCAVQYPVSSGSYVGIITGILGIGATLMSGNPAQAILSAGSHIGQAHTNVSHSGNISSNSGAMGPKKPYLIIERPIIAMPNGGEELEGVGENQRYLINELNGFVKVKKSEYNISCTDEELDMIKDILESGFYV